MWSYNHHHINRKAIMLDSSEINIILTQEISPVISVMTFSYAQDFYESVSVFFARILNANIPYTEVLFRYSIFFLLLQ